MRSTKLLLVLVLSALAAPLGWGQNGAATLVGENAVATDQEPQRAILVTGASSGIGRVTAELLASKGFYVYAGARKEKDLKELSAIKNVVGIRLDVTKPDEIAAAVAKVKAGGRGLYGLINNAGVVELAPLIEIPEGDLQYIMNVNVFGPYRVSKAFAPMIIESKGRISTTGSLSGYVVWGLGGPYCMTKHAVEAYSEALAAEMAQFGVKVSVVEPGNYKSKITTSMKKRLEAKGYSTEGSRYKGMLDGMLSSSLDRAQFKSPDEVADAFLHAMTADNPKLRYLVVPNQGEANVTIRAAMNKVVQLNADHEYSYDRDELVKMLDEALAASKN
ncbi:MAG: SDR family oxidoreductase [Planctomycetes bacterium]|nr:SDR family oxidoreductase [Planctomycetota bacterium]